MVWVWEQERVGVGVRIGPDEGEASPDTSQRELQ